MSNEEKYKEWFQRYYPIAYSYAVYYIQDNDIAMDLTQDVFVFMYENRNQMSDKSDIKSYILRCIKNKCINHLKHNDVIEKNKQFIHQEELDDNATLMQLENRIEEIGRVIAKLPAQRQKVLKMFYHDNMSYAEIATTLSISVNTVKDHIKKAYAFIRQEFNSDCDDSFMILCILSYFTKNIFYQD
ncbi:MAG: RNA polymerase sigma-70 factor [Marinifilaceae bacterium]